MSRRCALTSAAFAIVVALLAASCEAFEPPPTGGSGAGGPSTSAPGGTTDTAVPTASPGPTPVPTPRQVSFADLAAIPDGATIRIVGRIRTGTSTFCGGTCSLWLTDAIHPDDEIIVRIQIGSDSPPEPNTMESLGSGYSASDLRITAADGSTVRSGDTVALTGAVERASGGSPSLTSVERVERATVTLPKPIGVNFATISKQRNRALVRITGRLATPFLLNCFGGTCNLYLEDPKGVKKSVTVEVPLGATSERRPTTMWPLRDNFKESDLRVIASDGTVLRAGGLVRVTGWLRKSGSAVSIDPITRIEKAGG